MERDRGPEDRGRDDRGREDRGREDRGRDDGGTSAGHPAGRAPWWWLPALLVLVLACVGVVAGTVAQRAPLGVYDEWVFLDAVDKASRGDLVQQGEQIDSYALHISSCRGVGDSASVGSPCGGVLEPTAYPQLGVTTADIHPPTYYALAAGGAEVVQRLTPLDEPLDSARLTGALWLSLGVLLVVATARRLGAPRPAALLAGAACLALPLVRSVSTHLTPDALALAAGAGVGLATAHWQRGRSWVWLSLAAAAAVAVKAPFVLAAAACALVVLLSAGSGWARRLGGVLALGAPSAVVVLGWLRVHDEVSLGPSPVQAVVLGELSWTSVAGDLDVALGIPSDTCATETACLLGQAVGVLWALAAVAALVAAVATRGRRGSFAWWTGIALAALAAGPLAQLALHLATGSVFMTPPRYAIALVPLAAAVAAASLAQTVRQPSRTEEPAPATSTA